MVAKKTPLTARIRPDLARQLKEQAEAEGKSKTEILEQALEKAFKEGGERITEGKRAVSPENVDLIRDVIREELREALEPFKDAIQKNGRDTSVIHGRKEGPKKPKTPKPGRPGGMNPAGPTGEEITEALNRDLSELMNPEDLAALEPGEREKVRESLALVSWCLEVQQKYGGGIKTACKLAGTSDATYTRRKRDLKSKGIAHKIHLKQ